MSQDPEGQYAANLNRVRAMVDTKPAERVQTLVQRVEELESSNFLLRRQLDQTIRRMDQVWGPAPEEDPDDAFDYIHGDDGDRAVLARRPR